MNQSLSPARKVEQCTLHFIDSGFSIHEFRIIMKIRLTDLI